ncbi:RNA 2',3'-cyclic phosphodiesterase [Bacillus sp. Marseille-P3661]|uniref:RNA 2',3'-cyclic phosphodiesterase n=1 Tax=Bacillus sp. Marseille-P3661 TaxID=1936234 RepID=UPI000C8284FE|nr:RNA 2',3'-cyclic phosphodiesterase [Bacillus sp. Marseille-P3661]
MSTNPHYFIAIPLPSSLQDYFSIWQHELKNKISYKQWPHKQDLHITLKFLGGVDGEKIQQLRIELAEIEELSEFDLTVGKIGNFGNPRKPRVLWAGVERTEPLVQLQKTVESCAQKVGFAKENREYNPHITLAKKWAGESSIDNFFELTERYTEQQQLHVDEVVIYQIFPSKSPKYEIVQSYKLKTIEKS